MAITLKRKLAEEEKRKKKSAEADRFLEEKSKTDQTVRDEARRKKEEDRINWEEWIKTTATPPNRPTSDFGFSPPIGDKPIEFAGEGAARERGELSRKLERQRQAMIAAEERAEQQEQRPDIDAIIADAIAGVTPTGDVEKDKLSYEQAFKSALSTAGVGVAGGVATGAVAGAVGGAGIGAVPGAIGGAVIGGVSGFLAGFRSNLKTQRTDMVKGEAQNLMETERNMLKEVMLMNQLERVGGTTDDLVEIMTMFNEQMALTDENQQRLQMETSDDLSLWLGEDGHKQLEKYENFNAPGGMREILETQMRLAINSPDKARLPELQSQVNQLGAEINLE